MLLVNHRGQEMPERRRIGGGYPHSSGSHQRRADRRHPRPFGSTSSFSNKTLQEAPLAPPPWASHVDDDDDDDARP